MIPRSARTALSSRPGIAPGARVRVNLRGTVHSREYADVVVQHEHGWIRLPLDLLELDPDPETVTT